MRVQSLTLDYPPRRHIGSEMYTHRLNVALAEQHEVRATTDSVKSSPGFEGIPVAPFRWSETEWADLYICHADFAGPVISRGKPVVGICHNTEAGVLLSAHTHKFDLMVCNSETMREELAARDSQPYLVVHPPAPNESELSTGDMVTIVNLNDNKVGLFWEIAERLPHVRFLAVLGGYGTQNIPASVPANVVLQEHVAAEQMWERVWSRTRLLLAPSERESWNMTAGEALAHGIPTVSTDLPGVRENLGDTATYLERDDLDGWVQAVESHSSPDVFQRARFNADRHREDIKRFVEAVNDLWKRSS